MMDALIYETASQVLTNILEMKGSLNHAGLTENHVEGVTSELLKSTSHDYKLFSATILILALGIVNAEVDFLKLQQSNGELQ